jgi:hypothetical protein
MREMSAEETSKWAEERNKNLKPEEIEESKKAQERFQKLSDKGRVAIARGIVETPESILEKMIGGLKEVLEIPIDGQMLDMSLMAQSDRFCSLAKFFENREAKFPATANKVIGDKLDSLYNRLEKMRFELLKDGVEHKDRLKPFIEESTEIIGMIRSLWDAEDK